MKTLPLPQLLLNKIVNLFNKKNKIIYLLNDFEKNEKFDDLNNKFQDTIDKHYQETDKLFAYIQRNKTYLPNDEERITIVYPNYSRETFNITKRKEGYKLNNIYFMFTGNKIIRNDDKIIVKNIDFIPKERLLSK
jgi:hypothetical protein